MSAISNYIKQLNNDEQVSKDTKKVKKEKRNKDSHKWRCSFPVLITNFGIYFITYIILLMIISISVIVKKNSISFNTLYYVISDVNFLSVTFSISLSLLLDLLLDKANQKNNIIFHKPCLAGQFLISTIGVVIYSTDLILMNVAPESILINENTSFYINLFYFISSFLFVFLTFISKSLHN